MLRAHLTARNRILAADSYTLSKHAGGGPRPPRAVPGGSGGSPCSLASTVTGVSLGRSVAGVGAVAARLPGDGWLRASSELVTSSSFSRLSGDLAAPGLLLGPGTAVGGVGENGWKARGRPVGKRTVHKREKHGEENNPGHAATHQRCGRRKCPA